MFRERTLLSRRERRLYAVLGRCLKFLSLVKEITSLGKSSTELKGANMNDPELPDPVHPTIVGEFRRDIHAGRQTFAAKPQFDLAVLLSATFVVSFVLAMLLAFSAGPAFIAYTIFLMLLCALGQAFWFQNKPQVGSAIIGALFAIVVMAGYAVFESMTSRFRSENYLMPPVICLPLGGFIWGNMAGAMVAIVFLLAEIARNAFGWVEPDPPDPDQTQEGRQSSDPFAD